MKSEITITGHKYVDRNNTRKYEDSAHTNGKLGYKREL
jgi:hypothetical protein